MASQILRSTQLFAVAKSCASPRAFRETAECPELMASTGFYLRNERGVSWGHENTRIVATTQRWGNRKQGTRFCSAATVHLRLASTWVGALRRAQWSLSCGFWFLQKRQPLLRTSAINTCSCPDGAGSAGAWEPAVSTTASPGPFGGRPGTSCARHCLCLWVRNRVIWPWVYHNHCNSENAELQHH